MYVCMYVCYVCMYVCEASWTHNQIECMLCTYMCVHVYVSMCLQACIYVCMYVYVCMSMYVCMKCGMVWYGIVRWVILYEVWLMSTWSKSTDCLKYRFSGTILSVTLPKASEWVSEWVSGWVSEWVSGWVSECYIYVKATHIYIHTYIPFLEDARDRDDDLLWDRLLKVSEW